MSKLVNIGIDVTKIPKESIRADDKGRKWLNLDIWINDEEDQYGNTASCSVQQSKEQREAKVPKVYLGNGKKKFGWGDAPATVAAAASAADDDSDIPF